MPDSFLCFWNMGANPPRKVFFSIALEIPPRRALQHTTMKHTLFRTWIGLSCLLPSLPVADAFGAAGAGSPQVYQDSVEPHWFANNQQFWYRNDLRDGVREFVVVDVVKGTRQPAFDHAAIAQQIGGDVLAEKLPFTELEYSPDGAQVKLTGEGKSWILNLKSGALDLEDKSGATSNETNVLQTELQPRPSTRTGQETEITFVNELEEPVEVFWLDDQGEQQGYGTVEPGARKDQHTYAGHVWLVANQQGETLGVYEAADDAGLAIINKTKPTARQERRSRRNRERGEDSEGTPSPDGKWTAFVKDYNVFIRSREGEADARQLSSDGEATNAYRRLEWSPNSQQLVTWRVEPGDRKEVYLIRSSPKGGGRATFESRPYALPGDKFPRYELNLFDITTGDQVKPAVDRFEHEWLAPNIHWWTGTSRFAYAQDDRGHQRYRVIEVDAENGAVRNLVDEQSDTFIWTTHMEGPERLGVKIVTWLDPSREIIHASERDGWRHLYLVDADTGEVKNQITRGEWVVRGIDRIDEEKRQIWFKASGMNADQDPYLIHFYRINFDGTGLVALTEGNGNHSIEFSPDGQFLLDTYSRVDLPPVTELRRSSDGQLVCLIETADITELTDSGWQAPEVFSAKGRDGKTDIWGIIVRPPNLEPSKVYPVIEDVYAGPQDSFVPKTFSTRNRYETFTKLGFVVVKIDGMGTANRSKAFHDVCFKNLKDGGFPDRIAWMTAAAKTYPYMDVTRVGVYGTSAGGQNAAAAVLFHPEFYKAAAANCGCHDNRMDKASWNEQWMGYLPVEEIYEDGPDNWYAQCSNIENAEKLQGHLFLCVGEMDSNVPPESTLRFVDALIKANKDFEFLVVPNGGHGSGGAYYQRRLQDFFVRNLMGIEPPNRNASDGEVPAGS